MSDTIDIEQLTAQKEKLLTVQQELKSKTTKELLWSNAIKYLLSSLLFISLVYGFSLYYYVYVVFKNPETVKATLEAGKGVHFWLIQHNESVVYILKNSANLLMLSWLIGALIPLWKLVSFKMRKNHNQLQLNIIDLTLLYQQKRKVTDVIVWRAIKNQ